MTFSEVTEKRVVSFLRTVANRCAECNRRSADNCQRCLSKWAESILRDIELDRLSDRREIDYSIATRISHIILELERSNRPLKSAEIDLGGACSKQLKRWTLVHMVRTGRIARTFDRKNNCYLYSLNRETTHEDHAAGNQQLQAHQGRTPRA